MSVLMVYNYVVIRNMQDLIDKAQRTLVGNRNLIQKMQPSAGIPPASDSDDSAFANFNQVLFSLNISF